MRFPKLSIRALAATAAVLVIAPATALAVHGHRRLNTPPTRGHRRLNTPSARRHRQLNAPATRRHRRLNAPAVTRPGGCKISLVPEQRTITGESVQLIGQLRCRAGTSAEKQTVSVYQRAVGTPGFKLLGATETKEKEDGFFAITDSSVSADTIFYATALGARSQSVIVKVAPAVELMPPTPPENTQLFTGRPNLVTFAGKVSPADEGAELLLQRENAVTGELWITIQRHMFVGKEGKFEFKHKFIVPGDANVRVVVRPFGKFSVRGLSTLASYQISQSQLPGFSIETKHDSILPGEKVEITGKLAAGSGQKVTLFSHPRGMAPFTKVEEATTGAEGAYSFTETPAQNTFYIVRGPGKLHSAVLFEGVRDVLTPATPPSSVPLGQKVTLTGTISPAHKGQPVYLEKENLYGGGFHVIAKTEVAEEGTATYSLLYEFLAPGKKVLRVRVPGNPANQGAVTAPFDLEVTPAPLPLAKAVPPSVLPGEGQV